MSAFFSLLFFIFFKHCKLNILFLKIAWKEELWSILLPFSCPDGSISLQQIQVSWADTSVSEALLKLLGGRRVRGRSCGWRGAIVCVCACGLCIILFACQKLDNKSRFGKYLTRTTVLLFFPPRILNSITQTHKTFIVRNLTWICAPGSYKGTDIWLPYLSAEEKSPFLLPILLQRDNRAPLLFRVWQLAVLTRFDSLHCF